MDCAICTCVALCNMHCATLHLYNSLFEVWNICNDVVGGFGT